MESVAGRWDAAAILVAATGRSVTWEGVHFFTVHNGQITALWAIADVFNKALQLGVTLVPPEAETEA